MQKLITELATLIMGLGLIAIVGCEKEHTDPMNGAITKSNNQEYVELKSKVDGFMEKMNSKFKSGEIMSADSAAWYIETAINLTYSNGVPNTALKSSGSYRVISGGDLSMSEVAESYDMVLRDISNTYYSENNQEFSFVDVSLTADTLSWYHYYPDIDQTVDDTFKPIPPPDGFSERNKDYWYALWGEGKWQGDDAGYYANQGRDATTELTTRYNYWKLPKSSNKIVWTNVYTAYKKGGEDDPCNNYEHLWLGKRAGGGSFSNIKLTPSELNDYYRSIIPDIISYYQPYDPNMQCFRVDVYWQNNGKTNEAGSRSGTGTKDIKYYASHYMHMSYGIPIPVSPGATKPIPNF